MATKKKSLGKGLDVLLSSASLSEPLIEVKDGELKNIPVEHLQRSRFQPRQVFDQQELEDLARSIGTQGIIQPLVVRAIDSEQFEIIAGERRWRAAQMAGLADVPAVVRDIPDSTAIAFALIENIQRADLNPLEEAAAIERLIHEFEMTHEQVASAIGRSRTSVTNLLRLLTLHPAVKQYVVDRQLDMGHARCLAALERDSQLLAADKILSRRLSVRQAEALVAQIKNGKDVATAGKAQSGETVVKDPNIISLEAELSEKLGAKVQIQHTRSGKGKLVIGYHGAEEFDGIVEHLLRR